VVAVDIEKDNKGGPKMPADEPTTQFEPRFSSNEAKPTPWVETRERLEQADIFWLSTVRPDGRPHVTPLLAVWLQGSLHFSTGSDERKAKNLEENRSCILTTGSNALREGLDVVVEGEAVRITDRDTLTKLAEQYRSKYGDQWAFDVAEDALAQDGHKAIVFELQATKAFAFAKGVYGQTRYVYS
jgi:nitroimidazol reductase NimA-like FMN-containing flavoprotein (pyridoxamine 5'-phosphate oxidase superfamily)